MILPSGDFFTLREYRSLARESGHTLLECSGMPVTTLALPMLQLMARWRLVFEFVSRIATALDRRLDGLARLTVHRALLMRCAATAGAGQSRTDRAS